MEALSGAVAAASASIEAMPAAQGYTALVALTALLTVSAVISTSPLNLAAGAIFGPVRGALLFNLGCTLGSWVAFLLGRYLLKSWAARRLTESHFAEHHRRLGRSRFAYKKNGLLSSILPNLAKSAFQYGLYSVLRDDVRKYRAKGRIYHYSAMIALRRQDDHRPSGA